MKGLLVGLFFGLVFMVFFAVLALNKIQDSTKTSGTETAVSKKSEATERGSEDEFLFKDYQVVWYELKDISKLSLNPNYDEKLPTKLILEETECDLLVNAGFYTEDNKPVGLFVSNGETLREYSSNSLFNGVFYIKDGVYKISRSPVSGADFALQTGPILIEDGNVKKLTLKNDELARRVVLATTDDSIVFLVFYDPESAFLGPNLEDLPDLVADFGKDHDFEITAAINLDGGTASAFISDDINLTELSPIGSYFCVIE